MNRTLTFAALAAVVVGTSPLAADEAPPQGPLFEYVAKADDSFAWQVRRRGELGPTKYAELILTSQTWRGTRWRHQLFLLSPSTANADASHGLLYITGGNWREALAQPPPGEPLPREATIFAGLSERLASPMAVLLHVPQQPLFGGKVEDQIISHTFEQYLRTGEQDWPLLLPMVKSAVRGMDAMHQYAEKEWSLDLQTFTLTGASKRGWTTWLTAAVDQRVTAIAPMVIDVLNMGPQMEHQVEHWGDYSQQLHDYTSRGLPKHLSTPAGQKLREIVDPYAYRQRLKLPKLVMLGTNDPYWPLDALNIYWDGLEGEKHILYIPNNGHSLRDYGRLIGSLNALNRSAMGGKPLPKLSWKLQETEKLLAMELDSDTPPEEVRIWMATAPTRDFRRSTWLSVPIKKTDDGYRSGLTPAKEGYLAMFGEAKFKGDGMPFYLSTNVKIFAAKKTPAPAGAP